ncbi:hypothetical protein [Streptomyces sp. BBFR109]|uniref:hypothetical protein n=1 Tax=Streptomyces sp. BBFR109 TaxID=3448172 RepID=UPI003F776FEB
MIDISTNKLSGRKKVLIDGQEYVVRRLGAGDELAISQILRQLNKLQKKLTAPDLKSEQEAKFEEELNVLQERALKIYADTFDDGGDGSKSMELVSRLTYDERTELYDMIFNADKIKEAEAEQAKEGDGSEAKSAEA